MRKIYWLITILTLVVKLPAQSNVPACGTELLAHDSTWLSQLPWYGNNQFLLDFLDRVEDAQKAAGTTSLLCGGTTSAQFRVPVTATIVTRSDSTQGLKAFEAEAIIEQVNQLFQNNTPISFYLICEPFFLHDTHLFSGLAGDSASMDELYLYRDTEGAIDLFFIDTTRQANHGIARFPNELYDFHCTILTRRPSLSLIAETTAHEIAHCLNLLHTADGNRCGKIINHDCGDCRQESVSRTRGQGFPCDFIGHLKCEINGDFLCDTEADPGAHEKSYVTNCTFGPAFGSGFTNTDNWGDTWAPDITNLMSYATGCRSTFTPMQTAILISSVISYIPNYFPRVENDFDVFEPDNYPETATALPIGDVQCHTFHWSPLSTDQFSACDADWYRVEVAVAGSMAIKTFAVAGQPEPDTYLELFDSSMTLVASNDSLLGSDFAWIPATYVGSGSHFVRVSHRSTPGTPASRGHYHIQALYGQPVSLPSAADLPLRADIRYDAASQQLEVHFQRCLPGRYDLRLYDLRGRVHYASTLLAQVGNRHCIALPAPPAGLYLAELKHPRQTYSQKLLIL